MGCHQVLDLYSQQPSRTDSPQGLNTLPAKTLPTLPASTPTKSSIGRGFDQRLDAMQPKVEVSASANYVNYAMDVTPPVVAGLPPNIGVVPGVAPISVAPHSIPLLHPLPTRRFLRLLPRRILLHRPVNRRLFTHPTPISVRGCTRRRRRPLNSLRRLPDLTEHLRNINNKKKERKRNTTE